MTRDEILTVATRGTTLYDVEARSATGGLIRTGGLTEANFSTFKAWLEREGYTVDVTVRKSEGPRYTLPDE